MIVDGLKFEDINIPLKYCPWDNDKSFLDTFNLISNHTLVDLVRCYELWDLVEHAHNISDKSAFIEVGVWKGGTAAIIAQKLKNLKSKANLYLADTFSGVVKATEKDATYVGGEHSDTSIEIVKDLLKDNYQNCKILPGIFPDETAKQIPDKSFVFCHIDVDVYDSAKDIVDWIWDKLVVGGIIVFDDYGCHTTTGVTKYVNELKNKKDRIIVYNINGHAVLIKTAKTKK